MAATLGTWDYVIVGAGTAGCVLANRLSADPAVRVLLLEAGGKDDWIWIHIPVGYLYCIGNPRTDWCYRTEPDPGLNGRSILYARGKVLGGCSSINAMLYLRGQRARLRRVGAHHRRQRRGRGRACCRCSSARGSPRRRERLHGAGGEWRVEQQRLSWEILDAFREAMAQAGIPKVDDFNRGDNEGAAFFEVNQRRGVRWNATKAFLRPAMNRPNLTVMTDVHVEAAAAGRQARDRRRVPARRRGRVRRSARRNDPRGRRDRLAADPAALRHRSGARCCRSTASRWCTSSPASARTCRTTCSCAWSFKVQNAVTLNQRADSLWSARRDGARVRALPHRPAHDGAEPARRLREERPVAADRERRVPRAAAVARQVRRSAAPLSRVHRQRCATCARPRAAATSASRAPIRSRTRRSSAATCRRRKTARSPPTRCASRARSRRSPRSRATSRRSSCRVRNSRPTTSWLAGRRRRRHDDLPPGRHLQDEPASRSVGGRRFAAARARH